MLGLPRGVPQRIAASAFQAECRGFETRLPLQTPSCAWYEALARSTSCWLTVRMRDGDDHQPIYPREVVRIAGVEGQPVRQRDRSDHCVVGPCVRLPARASKRRCNLTECSGCLDIERKGIEVGFCLLEMGKAGGSFGLVGCHERSYREFREGDRRDERLVGQYCGVPEAGQQDQCVGVKQPRLDVAHRRGSTVESRSPRRAAPSIGGSLRQRARSIGALGPRGRTGRSSATGLPPRVTTRRSPAATRSTTSPPWLRSSRIVTSAMGAWYHG